MGCLRNSAEVTYLLNSGFAVELQEHILVFDYYKDAKKCLPELVAKGKKLYFFVSHVHFDHYAPEIAEFAAAAEKYFLSEDIRAEREPGIPKGQVIYMDTYQEYADADIKVTTYSSTDAGVSFLVELEGWKIFHAGDFNWWHWKGDTEENIGFAKNGFKKQMKQLDGLIADIAFFPVDPRLEEFADLGAREFCQRTNIQQLITMHNTTGTIWKEKESFISAGKKIPVWVTYKVGERKIIEKQG